jgi:hypothetical protein
MALPVASGPYGGGRCWRLLLQRSAGCWGCVPPLQTLLPLRPPVIGRRGGEVQKAPAKGNNTGGPMAVAGAPTASLRPACAVEVVVRRLV